MSSFRAGELAGGRRVESSPRSGGSRIGVYATIVRLDLPHGRSWRIHGVVPQEARSKIVGVERD